MLVLFAVPDAGRGAASDGGGDSDAASVAGVMYFKLLCGRWWL